MALPPRPVPPQRMRGVPELPKGYRGWPGRCGAFSGNSPEERSRASGFRGDGWGEEEEEEVEEKGRRRGPSGFISHPAPPAACSLPPPLPSARLRTAGRPRRRPWAAATLRPAARAGEVGAAAGRAGAAPGGLGGRRGRAGGRQGCESRPCKAASEMGLCRLSAGRISWGAP